MATRLSSPLQLAAFPRPNGPWRWALAGAMLLSLLLLGIFSEQIISWLIVHWQYLLQRLGLGHYAESLQHSVNGGIAKRPLLAIGTYAALYLSICLLLLHLLLTPAQWQLAWRLYAGMLAAYVLIAVLGKLAGNAQWAYSLGRHLLDFLVSPLPVAGLYVLFRAGFGPANERDQDAQCPPPAE